MIHFQPQFILWAHHSRCPSVAQGMVHHISSTKVLQNPPMLLVHNSFYDQVPSPRGSMHGADMRNPMYNFGKVSMRGHGSTRAQGSQCNHGSFRVLKDVHNPPQFNVAGGGKLQPYIETKLDISLFYQIFPDDVLGFGHLVLCMEGFIIRPVIQ